MTIHPRVSEIASKFEAHELHASRSGREVMLALASVVAETSSGSLDDVAARLTSNTDALLSHMPAYAPPLNVLHRIFALLDDARRRGLPVDEFRKAIASEAQAYEEWSQHARAQLALIAGRLIPDGGVVFTFTLSETVLDALRKAAQAGRGFQVIVSESRPNDDGLVTAKSLAECGVTVEVGIDAGVGELVPRADVMLVGAEAILADGSAVCKVGTYPAALIAKRCSIPIYVVVDSMKVDAASLMGQRLTLDPISRQEALPEGFVPRVPVVGHLFDRTPAELISGIVTERGLIHPDQICQWMLEMPRSELLAARLADRQGVPS